MDSGLIRRCGDERIARYTSYPTARHFGDAIGEREHRLWLETLDPVADVTRARFDGACPTRLGTRALAPR